MSRVGLKPIPLPAKVSINVEGGRISVDGPKGTLGMELPQGVSVEQAEDRLLVRRAG